MLNFLCRSRVQFKHSTGKEAQREGKDGKSSKILGGCNHSKAKTYVFAGMVIHNLKVGGSIPPTATNLSLLLNNYKGNLSPTRMRLLSNLCPD